MPDFYNHLLLMARRVLPYVLLFLVAQFITRLALAIYSRASLLTPGDWLMPLPTLGLIIAI